MDPAAAEQGMFYLWVALVILGLFTTLFVVRWYRKWHRRDVAQMTEAEAKEECAWLVSERLRIALYAAEIDHRIVEAWESWPEAYRPALFHVIRQAQLLEEVQLHEAYERGIIPGRVFTQVPTIAPPPDPPRLTEPDEPPPAARRRRGNVVPIRLRGSRWINGQLVKTA